MTDIIETEAPAVVQVEVFGRERGGWSWSYGPRAAVLLTLPADELETSTRRCDHCMRLYVSSELVSDDIGPVDFMTVEDRDREVCYWCVSFYCECGGCGGLFADTVWSDYYNQRYCPDCLPDDWDYDPDDYRDSEYREWQEGPFPGDDEPGEWLRPTRTVGAEIDVDGGRSTEGVPYEVGIGSDDWDIEVRTPPSKGKAGEVFIGETIRALRRNGWGANQPEDMGMHVHVHFPEGGGYTDRLKPATARLMALWMAVEDIAFRFCPARLYSTWCRPLTDNYERPERVKEAKNHAKAGERLDAASGRYRSMNTQALSRYNTVEFRLHHATLDDQHALAWVAFLQAVVDLSQQLSDSGLDEVETIASMDDRDRAAAHLLGMLRIFNLLTDKALAKVKSIILPDEE